MRGFEFASREFREELTAQGNQLARTQILDRSAVTSVRLMGTLGVDSIEAAARLNFGWDGLTLDSNAPHLQTAIRAEFEKRIEEGGRIYKLLLELAQEGSKHGLEESGTVLLEVMQEDLKRRVREWTPAARFALSPPSPLRARFTSPEIPDDIALFPITAAHVDNIAAGCSLLQLYGIEETDVTGLKAPLLENILLSIAELGEMPDTLRESLERLPFDFSPAEVVETADRILSEKIIPAEFPKGVFAFHECTWLSDARKTLAASSVDSMT